MGCLFRLSDALSFEKENYLFNPFSCQVCKDWKYKNGQTGRISKQIITGMKENTGRIEKTNRTFRTCWLKITFNFRLVQNQRSTKQPEIQQSSTKVTAAVIADVVAFVMAAVVAVVIRAAVGAVITAIIAAEITAVVGAIIQT